MEQYQSNIISILRAVVCRDGTTVPSDADWEKIWNFALRNHLEAAVYCAAPEEQKQKYQITYYNLLARTVRQEALLEQIEKKLSACEISYGLQKGSLLKYDYPDACLRFMSDMDFYIDPEERKAIRAAMESIGAVFTGTESGDEQFRFPGGLGIEFHGRLLYRKTDFGVENYPDLTLLDESRNRLTEEGFALNLIGHAVYDLSKGGPGLRYILDCWIYRHRHEPQPDWDYVWERLRKDNIAAAARNLLDLSEYLFADGEETPLMREMTAYVMAGGLHGDAARSAAVELAKAGGREKAVLRQLFRNRTEFENRYPWLHKHPYLLPLAWILRIANSLHRHRGTIASWANNMKAVSKEEIRKQQERQSRFGL